MDCLSKLKSNMAQKLGSVGAIKMACMTYFHPSKGLRGKYKEAAVKNKLHDLKIVWWVMVQVQQSEKELITYYFIMMILVHLNCAVLSATSRSRRSMKIQTISMNLIEGRMNPIIIIQLITKNRLQQ